MTVLLTHICFPSISFWFQEDIASIMQGQCSGYIHDLLNWLNLALWRPVNSHIEYSYLNYYDKDNISECWIKQCVTGKVPSIDCVLFPENLFPGEFCLLLPSGLDPCGISPLQVFCNCGFGNSFYFSPMLVSLCSPSKGPLFLLYCLFFFGEISLWVQVCKR